jgi:hypothetical protein
MIALAWEQRPGGRWIRFAFPASDEPAAEVFAGKRAHRWKAGSASGEEKTPMLACYAADAALLAEGWMLEAGTRNTGQVLGMLIEAVNKPKCCAATQPIDHFEE